MLCKTESLRRSLFENELEIEAAGFLEACFFSTRIMCNSGYIYMVIRKTILIPINCISYVVLEQTSLPAQVCSGPLVQRDLQVPGASVDLCLW